MCLVLNNLPFFVGRTVKLSHFGRVFVLGIWDFYMLVWLSRGVLSSGAGMCCILAQLLMQALGVRWEVKIGCFA